MIMPADGRERGYRTSLMVRRAVVPLAAVAVASAAVGVAVSLVGDGGRETGSTASVGKSDLGAHELAALSLTRDLPPTYVRACGKLSEHAPSRIAFCPAVIPAGPLEVEVASPLSRARRDRDGYVMSLASCSLNEYQGMAIETNGCHWAYEVGWSNRTRQLVARSVIHGSGNPANPRSVCRGRALAGERVRACRVRSFEEGGGFHGGHIAYLWEPRSAAIVLSAHGYLNEARIRAMMTALIEDVVRR